MFNLLRKSRPRLVPEKTARRFCDESFDNFIVNAFGADFALAFRERNRELFHQWKAQFFYPKMSEVFSETTPLAQMLALRGLIMELGKEWNTAKEYLASKYTDEDRQIISDKLFPSCTRNANDSTLAFSHVVCGSMMVILRLLADKYFDDFTKTDYLQIFLYMHRQLQEHLFKLTISKTRRNSKDQTIDAISELAIKTYEEQVNEIYLGALKGHTYNWDEETEMKRRAESDMAEERSKPLKRQTIYPGEIKQIVELLSTRFERSQRQQLYCVAGTAPPESTKFIHPDTALIWRALRENLIDPNDAETAIREIIWQFGSQFGSDETVTSKELINLDMQRIVLERLEDRSSDGWFLDFLFILSRYLYGAEEVESSASIKRLADVGIQIGKDAWPLYASVMNIFGWKMNTEWVFDSLRH